MIRCLAVLVTVLAPALMAVCSAGVTSANPPSEGAEEPSCTYTLSSPTVVAVSGVNVVTATLKPYPCMGSTNPTSLTVCVSVQGGDSTTQCKTRNIPDQAQVYFVPYRPGATYIVTGRGCSSLYDIRGSTCTSLGPYTATL
jgi:hypothetical protein